MTTIIEDSWTLQDNTYVATFPQKQGKIIKEYLKLARERHDSNWLAGIHNGIKKTWEDKTLGPGDIEPTQVVFKKDKVTMEGMELFNTNIMLKSTTLINYMAVGAGTSQTYANQQALQSEVARANMSEDGFMNAEGLFLLWEDIFDTLVPSFSCNEVGIFTAASGGTMVARAVLGQAVAHDYGNDWLYVQFFISTMSS